MAQACEGLACW